MSKSHARPALRTDHEIPPKVEYSLTEFGVSLNEVLLPLCEWGERHMDHIQAMRRCPQSA